MEVNTKGHILVADNDPHIVKHLSITLKSEGYKVHTMAPGNGVVKHCRFKRYDLVLLEVDPPGISGLRICKKLCEHRNTPIIMLAASDETSDKIEALDAGACAYLTKPIAMAELLSRIRAVLRRSRLPIARLQNLILNGVEINLDGRKLVVEGKRVRLSPKEFELLQYLVIHPNRTIPCRELLRALWGREHERNRAYLRVFMARLRKKINANSRDPKFLLTDMDGYRICISDEAMNAATRITHGVMVDLVEDAVAIDRESLVGQDSNERPNVLNPRGNS